MPYALTRIVLDAIEHREISLSLGTPIASAFAAQTYERDRRVTRMLVPLVRMDETAAIAAKVADGF
ncbi:hypothetical protein BQ8794_50710 [Mesorhizobium prunaredense]|uniref:Uncharacterized protein n=1 Tax=Mesorhizobium prunaredense TaxID=1631249 RepID=A0A1R3VFH7_9HYPH|nr:hypothetical protein BQ8794_50710 [Mesorhizobium prunaredense]